MNTKPLSLAGRKFSLFIALPLLTFSLLACGTFANAGDRDSYAQRKARPTQYKKQRGKGLLQALVDHHRKERAFILGLITGGREREYYGEEECCDPEPVREYHREPVRRYAEPDREPVRRYRKPDPEPTPVRAPAPVPESSNHKYPGYSGY